MCNETLKDFLENHRDPYDHIERINELLTGVFELLQLRKTRRNQFAALTQTTNANGDVLASLCESIDDHNEVSDIVAMGGIQPMPGINTTHIIHSNFKGKYYLICTPNTWGNNHRFLMIQKDLDFKAANAEIKALIGA